MAETNGTKAESTTDETKTTESTTDEAKTESTTDETKTESTTDDTKPESTEPTELEQKIIRQVEVEYSNVQRMLLTSPYSYFFGRGDSRTLAQLGTVSEVLTLKIPHLSCFQYYFGDINLARDKFLHQQIKEDDGCILFHLDCLPIFQVGNSQGILKSPEKSTNLRQMLFVIFLVIFKLTVLLFGNC